MEYKSRHAQPFTVEQATLLQVPEITAEIARLQNSLQHLRDTQQQLQESVEEENAEKDTDPVILEALEENKVVISSQEERVSMLRLALELKGLSRHTNAHYDPKSASDLPTEPSVASPSDNSASQGQVEESPAEDDGVFL